MSDNDATSAFAGLVESENIEKKAEAFTGSAPDEGDNEESLMTQHKQVKKDISLLEQENNQEAQVQISTGKTSKLQGVIDQL